MAQTKVCATTALGEGEALKFTFVRDGVNFEGFVIRFGGEYFAYQNRCRHLPLPLDLEGDRFFTTDQRHLVCSSHGAIYEPATGQCVRGPCEGASLKRMKLEVLDGQLIVIVPE